MAAAAVDDDDDDVDVRGGDGGIVISGCASSVFVDVELLDVFDRISLFRSCVFCAFFFQHFDFVNVIVCICAILDENLTMNERTLNIRYLTFHIGLKQRNITTLSN